MRSEHFSPSSARQQAHSPVRTGELLLGVSSRWPTFDKRTFPMKTLLFSSAWVCASFAAAQSPANFLRVIDTPGDNAYATFVCGLVAPDGGIFLLGGYQNIQEPAFTLAKYDSTGQFLWGRKVESSSAGTQMEPKKVVRMSTGDLMVFGTYASGSGQDYFVTRVDPDGDVQWTRTYHQQYEGFDYGFSSIVATSDDELVMSMGLIDRTIAMRLDMDGEPQWANHYVTDLSPTNKNPGFDFAATADGGVLLTEKAEDDIYLVRLDSTGAVEWAKRYPNGGYCHTNTAILLADGGFLIAGSKDAVPFAARIDDSGGMIWQKEYAFDEGAVENFDHAMELTDGDYLLTPSQNSSGIMAMRVSPLGTPVACYTITGGGYMRIIGRQEDLVVLGGRTLLEVDGGFEDAILLSGSGENLDPDCLQGTTGATGNDITIPPPIHGCNVAEEPIVEGSINTFVSSILFGTRQVCPSLVAVSGSPGIDHFSVFPSLISAGSPFRIELGDMGDAVSVECFSIDGRSMAQTLVRPGASSAAVSTANWAIGLYVIRATGRDGSVLATTRIVVE